MDPHREHEEEEDKTVAMRRRDDEELERIFEDHHREDEKLMDRLGEASRRRRRDEDTFKLHFPVANDRTMRRLAISQLILLILAPASCVGNAVLREMSTVKPTQFGMREHIDFNSLYAQLSFVCGTIAVISLIALFIVVPIMHSSIMTRRYGWRAMQDPIEAQRVAVREGMADVLTAKNRSNIDPDLANHALVNRRTRPITARR